MESKEKVNKLRNLIEELKKIDVQIAEHRRLDSDNYMINQYEHLKVKLLGHFFDDVKLSHLKSPATDVYFLGLLAKKYFLNSPDQASTDAIKDSEFRKLLNAI
ncbi:MAG: hypothetical protein ACRC3B_09200 [Bacteroidia bacterium]